MIADTLQFKDYLCFKGQWSDIGKPGCINVVIGRNNVGKSFLLDFIQELCASPTLIALRTEMCCKGKFEEADLKQVFQAGVSEGTLGGNHWADHGAPLDGKSVTWQIDSAGTVGPFETVDLTREQDQHVWKRFGERSNNEKKAKLTSIVLNARSPYSGLHFRRIMADRDIVPEEKQDNISMRSPGLTRQHCAFDGKNATNLIRKYLHTTSSDFDKAIIRSVLRDALNEVFGADGAFDVFDMRVQDYDSNSESYGKWELFLHEKGKPDVALSRSGSGLKTVLLVLLNLLVIPHLEDQSPKKYVFAFEELENNLHPSLLRRLFKFLDAYVEQHGVTVYLTTHSSVAIDYFGSSPKHQIIHVSHDGLSATAKIVNAHFDRVNIISGLGAKPSDLLQANGVIWVEGPSDRIYINRFIDLYSDGKLREGAHYQCVFYGGALLARTAFVSPDLSDTELANLLRVNPNVGLLCDGDRKDDTEAFKDRVIKAKEQVDSVPRSWSWATEAKEIENYIPGECWSKVYGKEDVPDPELYDLFPSSCDSDEHFVFRNCGRKSFDKVGFATEVSPYLSTENLDGRFELKERVLALIETIRSWNE